MRFLFNWWRPNTKMSTPAATIDASSVTAIHDGGPDWEGREKASFESRRGDSIWYRKWSPKAGTKVVAMLMICHGLHSHSGRWTQVAHYYTAKGYLVFANDHVGHGLTAQAATEGASGIVDDFTNMSDDFTDLIEKMVEKEEDKALPVFVLGHSMGSLVATVAAKNCLEHATLQPRLKKLVLSGCPLMPGPSAASPFGIRFLFPLTKNAKMLRRMSGLMARIDPKGPAAPISQDALSKDAEVKEEALVDPLMVKGSVRNKTAFEFSKLAQLAKDCAPKISVPTLLIHGADDDIAYASGSEQMEKLMTGSDSVNLEVYPGVLHEVLRHKEVFSTVMAAIDRHWEDASLVS